MYLNRLTLASTLNHSRIYCSTFNVCTNITVSQYDDNIVMSYKYNRNNFADTTTLWVTFIPSILP